MFGIINAQDMCCYLKRLYNYLASGTDLSKELKSFMIKPSYEIINLKNIGNNEFVKKYGGFGIAYHEAGIVFDDSPFLLIILTQKFELKENVKKRYINKVAKKIYKIHKLLRKVNR